MPPQETGPRTIEPSTRVLEELPVGARVKIYGANLDVPPLEEEIRSSVVTGGTIVLGDKRSRKEYPEGGKVVTISAPLEAREWERIFQKEPAAGARCYKLTWVVQGEKMNSTATNFAYLEVFNPEEAL